MFHTPTLAAVSAADSDAASPEAGRRTGVLSFTLRVDGVRGHRITWVSSRLAEVLGLGLADLAEAPELLFRWVAEQDRPRLGALFSGAANDPVHGPGPTIGFEFPENAGLAQRLECEFDRQAVDEGAVLWHGTLRDVSLLSQTLDDLRIANIAFQHSTEAILITDAETRIIGVNRSFTDITGYALEDVRGQKPSVLASGRHDAAFFEAMWRELRASDYWQGEIWNRNRQGMLFPEHLQIVAIRNGEGEVSNYLGIFSDITARKADEHKIRFLAYHDTITRLPNRLALSEAFDRALPDARRSGRPIGLVFIDLDRFKEVNDSLGHTAGDELLIKVTARLKETLREYDTLARLGGDEFALLAPHLNSRSDVLRIAEKVQAAMRQPFTLRDRSLQMTFSIGVSLCPDDGESFDLLLQRADTAMYVAKSAGRNTIRRFEPWMHSRTVEGLELRNRLNQALRKGQFELHYQPQLELQTGRVVGCEGLIRWNDPERGMTSPALFIPAAEDSGLIVPIGEWVLRQACEDIRRLADLGHALQVSVNVSGVQLRRPDFVDMLRRILLETRIEPAGLELEITESALLGEDDFLFEVMEGIDRLGVKLAIDDFGTGYSNLKRLSRVRADRLKIDRSFIMGLPEDNESVVLTDAIIRMAAGLGLRCVAEGVETREQAEFLRRAGCQEIQGYWLARPAPIDTLLDFLARGPVAV